MAHPRPTLVLLLPLLVLILSAKSMAAMKVQRCILKAYPNGPLSPDLFEFDTQELQAHDPLPKGSIVVQLQHISVDPYLRTRFQAGQGYIMPGFELGKPLDSMCLAEVIQSNNVDYPVGSLVSGNMNWETVQVVHAPTLQKVPQVDGLPTTYYLGVLGLTGLSAYLPFKHFARDYLRSKTQQPSNDNKPPVVVVSGAAVAVGSVFAQLCKSVGCTVYGSAGTDDKVALCQSKLGCDQAFNYKHGIAQGLDAMLADPETTIDLYFDNVGGEMLDQVLLRMTKGGKIICCGSIADYDKKDEDKYRLKNAFCIVTKCLQLQGFLLGQWMNELPEASNELGALVTAKSVVPQETVLKGFDKVVDGLIGLFQGANTGKMIISL